MNNYGSDKKLFADVVEKGFCPRSGQLCARRNISKSILLMHADCAAYGQQPVVRAAYFADCDKSLARARYGCRMSLGGLAIINSNRRHDNPMEFHSVLPSCFCTTSNTHRLGRPVVLPDRVGGFSYLILIWIKVAQRFLEHIVKAI
jgi:hypothetical protein